jgi:gamma-glutamyl:cysteine ligase YbdK (ATP-grasp superfamily)
MHINLSFSGDEELGRLHAAVRLLLPLIPALAASSPVVEGKVTGIMDNRLTFYRKNQILVPSISGDIIPEPIFTRSEYEGRILQKMYEDIAVYDPEGVLQHEWLNSRGAIPKFQKSAIEVRLADTQECPMADIAVANAVVSVLKALINNRWTSRQEQAAWQVGPLLAILEKTISSGEAAVIEDPEYLGAFGYPKKKARAADIWGHLINECLTAEAASDNEIMGPLRLILDKGTLSRRILKSVGKDPSASRLHTVYEKLCDCLAQGSLFAG